MVVEAAVAAARPVGQPCRPFGGWRWWSSMACRKLGTASLAFGVSRWWSHHGAVPDPKPGWSPASSDARNARVAVLLPSAAAVPYDLAAIRTADLDHRAQLARSAGTRPLAPVLEALRVAHAGAQSASRDLCSGVFGAGCVPRVLGRFCPATPVCWSAGRRPGYTMYPKIRAGV